MFSILIQKSLIMFEIPRNFNPNRIEGLAKLSPIDNGVRIAFLNFGASKVIFTVNLNEQISALHDLINEEGQVFWVNICPSVNGTSRPTMTLLFLIVEVRGWFSVLICLMNRRVKRFPCGNDLNVVSGEGDTV